MTRSHSQNGGISDNETIPSEHTSPCASLHLSRLDSSRLVLSSPSPRCLPPLPLPSSTSALVNIRPVKPTTPSPPRAVPMNSNPFFRSSKWAQHHHPRLASVDGVCLCARPVSSSSRCSPFWHPYYTVSGFHSPRSSVVFGLASRTTRLYYRLCHLLCAFKSPSLSSP